MNRASVGKPEERKLTFGSLFAGIGGFDLGFERAGLECKWQVEIDPFCRRVLAKHWPTVQRHDDVRTFPPEGDWKVDVICGGDPCQANSAAVGGGNSVHESLGDQFIRIVDALRPTIVVRENPSLVRKDAPWPWFRFRSELESLGYSVMPFRLRACCFGAFHQRDRLFLLAEATDSRCKRLEGREAETQDWNSGEPEGRVHADDWLSISASRGLRSRARFPNYVDRVKSIGNSVHPAVSEWIGQRVLEATKPVAV